MLPFGETDDWGGGERCQPRSPLPPGDTRAEHDAKQDANAGPPPTRRYGAAPSSHQTTAGVMSTSLGVGGQRGNDGHPRVGERSRRGVSRRVGRRRVLSVWLDEGGAAGWVPRRLPQVRRSPGCREAATFQSAADCTPRSV